MPSTVPALLLSQNSEIRPAKITLSKDDVGCQLLDIQKYLKKKSAPEVLGTYSWKNQTLFLIGYKEGKAGTENQHELPPPWDKDLYFGDIILLLSKDKKSFARPLPMKSEEYETFYTQIFEGFESLGESDSEEEDEFEEEDEEEPLNDEAEFEENEEQGEFSDDQDAEEELEGFIVPKLEEEEEILPILVKKKTPAKTSKSKGKSSKEVHIPLPPVITVELTPETQISTTLPVQDQRLRIVQAFERLVGSVLTQKELLELEHHIFNTTLQVATKKHISKNWLQPVFGELYTSLARSVIGNFKPDCYVQNKALFTRYKEGKLSLEELANYGFSDLYPEIWKDLSIRQFEREKRQLEGNKSMATDQFECKRCHKRECTYYELQTRSADEPMTIFIQCVNCGKHWRQ